MPACFWANMERTENMEFEKIKELIQAVSQSDLTRFYMEDGNLKISMKAGKKTVVKGVKDPIQEEKRQKKFPLLRNREPLRPLWWEPFTMPLLPVQRFLYRRGTA